MNKIVADAVSHASRMAFIVATGGAYGSVIHEAGIHSLLCTLAVPFSVFLTKQCRGISCERNRLVFSYHVWSAGHASLNWVPLVFLSSSVDSRLHDGSACARSLRDGTTSQCSGSRC